MTVTRRIESIDVLRGVAILLVVGIHLFKPTFGITHLPDRGNWPDWEAAPGGIYPYVYPLTWGWSGVSLFFVLSGFSIHWSVLHKPLGGWGAFYVQRFFRIWPAYVVSLGAAAVVNGTDGWADVVTHVFLVHNVLSRYMYTIHAVFWSLAIEWQLYVIYPAAYWILRRRGPVALIVITLALNVILAFPWEDTGVPVKYARLVHRTPFNYWFSWCLGVWVAERFWTGRRAFPRSWAVTAALGVIAFVASKYRPVGLSYNFLLASIFWAAVVDRCLSSEAANGPPSLAGRALALTGVWSYSLYLWHIPLIDWLAGSLALDPSFSFLVVLATVPLMIGFAGVMYRAVERPAIRLGRRVTGRLGYR